MSKEAMNTDFNEWFNQLEGFHIKSERFYESLTAFSNEALAINMVKWLEAAFEAGRATEQKRTGQEIIMMSEHCAELVLAEREACAKVCLTHAPTTTPNYVSYAAAIRARSRE